MGIGTATIDGIVHVDSDTAVVQQQSDSLNLHLGRVVANLQGHVVPVIGGLAEVGSQGTKTGVVVGVATRALQRMIPILHHLTHGRSHATGIDTTAGAATGLRAKIVVGRTLVPLGLHQMVGSTTTVARNQGAAIHHEFPFSGDHRGRLAKQFATAIGDQFIQHIGKLGVDVVGIEVAFIGITDDGTENVIGRDHDETVVADIEHIEASLATGGSARIDQSKGLALARLLEVGLDKLLSHILGLALADRVGLNHTDAENQGKQTH